MRVRFFKLHKNKTFEYIPRYYDERKEKLNERIKKMEQQMGLKEIDESYIPRIKGQFKTIHSRNFKEKKKSNLRLVIILFILFIAAYYLFFR